MTPALWLFLFASASPFAFEDRGNGQLALTENGKPVFVYNFGPQLKAGVPEDRRRSAYLHPVYTPAGFAVTDDFPRDHYHHRGVFWAWPIVRAGGAKFDLWALKGAEHRFVRFRERRTNRDTARFVVENAWLAGGREIVREIAGIEALASRGPARELVITLTLEAREQPVEIAGAPEEGKGYGGLSARFAPRERTVIRTSEGPVTADENHVAHTWAELEGSFAGGTRASLRITADREHEWCLRPYGFVSPSFPGVQPYRLEPAKPLTLRYRVRVSDVPNPPADTSSEPDLAWFREAKFGMFIHWGPYSLASVEASWPIMRPGAAKNYPAIAEADYRALPLRFNPVRYDPRAWVRLAKAAGQRYMVFTAKHHDGFAMFDSAYTSYKITRTPYGKDVAAMLAGAAREEGMPLGFYYSPPDMNHPGFRDTSRPSSENWQGQPERPEWPLYLDYMELQLRELLARYAPVRIVWFDGLGQQEKYAGERFVRLIRRLSPGTLVNNRIGVEADYETPEQFVPKAIPVKGVRIVGTNPNQSPLPGGVPDERNFRTWETCMSINQTWGYNRNDREFKSVTRLIRTLTDVASKGGNLLLNVGPTPEGAIQPEFEERLRAMGEWLKGNGEAIYGTTYGPWQDLSFGRSTRKGATVYLHVFDWPAAGRLEIADPRLTVTRARLLAGGAEIRYRQADGALVLELPAAAPDPHATVIALEVR